MQLSYSGIVITMPLSLSLALKYAFTYNALFYGPTGKAISISYTENHRNYRFQLNFLNINCVYKK